jgi:hypothetical protein
MKKPSSRHFCWICCENTVDFFPDLKLFKAAATSAAQRSEYPLPTSPSTNPPGMVPKYPVMTGTRSLQARSFVCTVDITSSYKLGLVFHLVLDVMESERSMYSEAIPYGCFSLALPNFVFGKVVKYE